MTAEIPDGTMVCQYCGGDGEAVEVYLTTDSVLTPDDGPNLESEEVTCPSCDGDGYIPDPEATSND